VGFGPGGLAQPDQIIFHYCKNILPILWLDQCQSREFAEGWQNTMCICKIKAWKTQRLLRHSPDLHSRMDMATENIVSLFLFIETGIVTKTKILYAKFFLVNCDLTFFIPGFGQDVMIPFDKMDLQQRKIISPSFEEIQFFI
jgi:hypothetical protein